MAACAPQNGSDQAASEAGTSGKQGDRGSARSDPKGTSRSVEAPPAPRPPATEAEERLQQGIRRLGEDFDGTLGIAVRDLEKGWTAHLNGEKYFPQQSVSKLWVALTLLDQADRGQIDLSEQVTLRREDLTLFYQPIRRLILRPEGYTTTLGDLLERAITTSDNTANDFLLRRVGGPDAVRQTLRRMELGGIRFGPGERELQSEIAGLQWKPEYSLKRTFFEAREEVPQEKRSAAFEAYVKDPVDGATPIGIANALGRLKKGELLSPASTERLLSIMNRTRSGPNRLKGGLAPGWSAGHKTGTGQILGGTQAGYNDVGLITSPDGRTYSVAILIGRTDRPLPVRMELMHETVGAVVTYNQSVDP